MVAFLNKKGVKSKGAVCLINTARHVRSGDILAKIAPSKNVSKEQNVQQRDPPRLPLFATDANILFSGTGVWRYALIFVSNTSLTAVFSVGVFSPRGADVQQTPKWLGSIRMACGAYVRCHTEVGHYNKSHVSE